MDSLTLDSEETRRLLVLAQAGDRKARSLLFARHRAYLCRLIELRIDPRLRPRVDPSDVVQEAQMEANRRLDLYLAGPALPFRLWLRQIAYDRLLMLRRRHVEAARRTVERAVPLPERSSLLLAQQILAADAEPGEQMVRREFGHRVREAVGELSEADRESSC